LDSLGQAQGSIRLDAANALSALNSVKSGLSSLGSASIPTTGLNAFSDRILSLQSEITELGQNLTVIGLGITGAFTGGIVMAANFEQGMDGVAAAFGGVDTAAGITTAQFKALQEEGLRIGATTSKSANEAAGAMDLMAKAGIPVETVINGGAQAVVNLSEATDEQLAQSASTFSSLMLLFADTGISSEQMADQITGALNNSKATLSEFETGMARLAPVIKGGSLSFGEASTAIAYFNAQGFGAAETGTSLASIFTSVTTPATQEAKDALNALGVQAFDTQGNFIGYPALFEQVAAGTAGMTEEQKAAILSTAFMTDGMDLLSVATATTGDEMLALEGKIETPGLAAEASAIRMDNFKGGIEELKGAIETIAIVVLSRFLPAFKAITDVITQVVSAFLLIPAPIQTAIAAFVGLAGVFSLVAGGVLLMLPRILSGRAAILAIANAGRPATALLTSLSGVFGVAARAALGLLNPIKLLSVAFRLLIGTNPIIAALSLGFLAFQTNFLGFGDLVRKIGSGIADFASTFSEAFNSLRSAGETATVMFGSLAVNVTKAGEPINAVSAFVHGLATAIRTVNFGPFEGAANAVANGLDAIGAAITAVLGWINTLKSTFSSAFAALSGGEKAVVMFGNLAVNVTRAGTSINKVSAFFKALAAGIRAVKWGPFQKGADAVADGLDAIGDGVQTFIEAFKQARAATDPLSAALFALGSAFPRLQAALAPVLAAIQALKIAFADFRSAGLNPVQAALLALGSVFPSLMGPVQDLMAAFQSWVVYVTALKDAFAAFFSGDFGEGFSKLGEAAKAAFDTIVSLASGIGGLLMAAFEAIDWGAVGSALQSGFLAAMSWLAGIGSQFLSWISDAVAGIDWAAVWDGVQDATSAIISKLGNLLTALIGWIGDNAPSAEDWKALLSKAGDIVSGLSSKLGDLGKWAIKWISDAAGRIDWATLLQNAKNIVNGLSGLLGDLGAWAVKWISDAAGRIDWFALLSSAADIVTGLSSRLGDLGAWAIKWVSDAAGKIDWSSLVSGAANIVNGLSGKLGDLGAWAVRWITDAAARTDWAMLLTNASNIVNGLSGKLGDLGAWAIKWVTDAGRAIDWKAILSKATNIVNGLSSKLGDLAAWARKWITDAAANLDWFGLLSTATDIVTGLSGKLGNLGAWAAKWIADAASALDWFGLLSGAVNIVNGLSGRLGDLGVWAIKWVSDAAGRIDWAALLTNARNIVNGLSAKLGDLGTWAVKWVTDAAAAIDWRALLSKAANIVNGLSSRLGNLIEWVKKWISDAIPGADVWLGILDNIVDITGDITKGLGDIVTAMGDWAQGGIDAAQDLLSAITFDIPGITLPGQGGDDEDAPEPAAPVVPDLANLAAVRVAVDLLYASLVTLNSGLNTVGSAISGLGAYMQSFYTNGLVTVNSGVGTVGSTFARLYTTLTTVVSGLITTGTTFTQLYTVLTTVVSGLITTGLTFTQLYATMPPVVSGLITIGTTFTQLYVVLATVVSGLITAGLTFTQLYATLPPIVSGLITLGSAFTQLYTVLTTIVSGLITTGLTFAQLQLVIDTFALSFTAFTTATDLAMATWATNIQLYVTGAMTNMQSTISLGTSTAKQSVLTFAADTTVSIINWAIDFQASVTGTMTHLRSTVSSGTSTAKQSVLTFSNDSSSAMRTWASNTRSAASDAMSGLTGAVRNGMGDAVRAVRSGVSDMVRAARGAAGDMRSAGSDAIGGLTRGVRDGLGGLRAAVDEAISIMARIPKLGNSPWPMMIGAGTDAMDGLIIGWDRRLGALRSQVATTVSAMLTPVQAIGGALRTVIDSLKAFGGDNTPRVIVDAAKALEAIVRGIGGTVISPVRAADGATTQAVNDLLRQMSNQQAQIPAYAYAGMGATGNTYGGNTYIDRRVDVGGISVVQQPGQSQDSLVRQIKRELNQEEFDALGPV